MRDSERFKLRFGPYRTPRFMMGAAVQDAWRGKVRIVGISSARIAWPVGKAISKSHGNRSLVVYGSLAMAIRRESVQAVAYWWGLSPQTVSKWRRRLGLSGKQTKGTSQVRAAHFGEPWAKRTRKLAWAKARDPKRRAKISTARRGKPRPAHVIEALRRANTGRQLSIEHRRKLSAAHKRRGTRPPKAGRPWMPSEDALLGTLPAAEVSRQTGRTLQAVYDRRGILGLPDGRRRTSRH